jgi:hypothetical protein
VGNEVNAQNLPQKGRPFIMRSANGGEWGVHARATVYFALLVTNAILAFRLWRDTVLTSWRRILSEQTVDQIVQIVVVLQVYLAYWLALRPNHASTLLMPRQWQHLPDCFRP